MGYFRRCDTPIASLIIAVLVYAVFLAARLEKKQYDFSAFIVAGDFLVDAAAAPPGITILPDSAGYDGQFYYRLALTPFTHKQTDFGITLDFPAYRQQRILYPLLARLLALANLDLLPAALVLVNYLALCSIAWTGARCAQMAKHHALWGLLFGLYPGFLLTLSRDTSEIVAMAFLLAAILALRTRRQYLAGALLILSVLSRESALILSLSILAANLLSRKWQDFHDTWFPMLAPPIMYALWQLWLKAAWHIPAMDRAVLSDRIGVPFLGMVRFIGSILPPANRLQKVWLIEAVLLVLFVLAVAKAFSQSRAGPFIKASWLLNAAILFSFTHMIWIEDWGFLRVLPEAYLLGVIILLENPLALTRWIFGATSIAWALLGMDLIITGR